MNASAVPASVPKVVEKPEIVPIHYNELQMSLQRMYLSERLNSNWKRMRVTVLTAIL